MPVMLVALDGVDETTVRRIAEREGWRLIGVASPWESLDLVFEALAQSTTPFPAPSSPAVHALVRGAACQSSAR